MMKKCIAAMLAVLMVFGVTACGSKQEEPAADTVAPIFEESLETIYTELCEKVEDAETKDFIKGFMVGEITADSAAYYIGSEEVDYKEAIFAEPMMSSIAFSICLVRVNEGADMEAQKTLIKENVDPIKWLCVQADTVLVENIGDVIILVMADDRANMIVDAFNALNVQ